MSTIVPLAVPSSVPREIQSSGNGLPPKEVGTRFHLSLNVSSIERVASFLQMVLGVAPAKLRSDYAKFELDSPPLVLSLEPNPPQESGSLNHLGFRFASIADLLNAQQRTEAAGIATQREEGVECCYAKQTKFWVHDPDQRLWEFYVLEGDLAHRGGGQTMEQMVGDSTACSVSAGRVLPVIWEHRMGSEFALPATSSDQVRLRGSFNVPMSDSQTEHVIQDVYNHLKPGGQVELHMLTTETPVQGDLQLPGPAAYVKHVPVRLQLMQQLAAAGFVDCMLTTFRSAACFQWHGTPLRETKIVAVKPHASASELVTVVYRGPFAEIKDDCGHVWRRGEPTAIPSVRWDELKQAGLEQAFTLIPQTSNFSQCGS